MQHKITKEDILAGKYQQSYYITTRKVQGNHLPSYVKKFLFLLFLFLAYQGYSYISQKNSVTHAQIDPQTAEIYIQEPIEPFIVSMNGMDMQAVSKIAISGHLVGNATFCAKTYAPLKKTFTSQPLLKVNGKMVHLEMTTANKYLTKVMDVFNDRDYIKSHLNQTVTVWGKELKLPDNIKKTDAVIMYVDAIQIDADFYSDKDFVP